MILVMKMIKMQKKLRITNEGTRYTVNGTGSSNISPSFLVNQAASRLAKVFPEAIQKTMING
jgi:hypothetical protein